MVSAREHDDPRSLLSGLEAMNKRALGQSALEVAECFEQRLAGDLAPGDRPDETLRDQRQDSREHAVRVHRHQAGRGCLAYGRRCSRV
jgi:hypothetical protein